MINRVLLVKTSVLSQDSMPASEKPLELEYYLTVSSPDRYLINDETEVYGILVAKRLDEVSTEEELVTNFSCSREDTVHVVRKLAENKVTPLELPYIIDDLLGV